MRQIKSAVTHLSVVLPWRPADQCRPHPSIGDHAHPASPHSGLRAISPCPGPLSPSTLRGRRSPRQREPRGDVRVTTAYVAPAWLAMPCEIVPPSFSRRPAPRPSPRKTPDPSAARILSRLSRPRLAAPRLAAIDCGGRRTAGADGGSGEAKMPFEILILSYLPNSKRPEVICACACPRGSRH